MCSGVQWVKNVGAQWVSDPLCPSASILGIALTYAFLKQVYAMKLIIWYLNYILSYF